jgi:hypothetical protein
VHACLVAALRAQACLLLVLIVRYTNQVNYFKFDVPNNRTRDTWPSFPNLAFLVDLHRDLQLASEFESNCKAPQPRLGL